MKFLSLVLLATLTTATALADAIPPSPPMQELKPIRMAKAHIVVTKLSFVASPDPHTNDEPVCDQTIQVPVYDSRGVAGNWWYQTGQLDCASTLGQTSVSVHVSPSIVLANGMNSTGRKDFYSSLFVSPTQAGTLPSGDYSAGSSAWSHDLSLRSIGLTMTPSILWSCESSSSGPVVSEPQPGPHQDSKFRTSSSRIFSDPSGNQGEPPPASNCKASLDQWYTASVEFED